MNRLDRYYEIYPKVLLVGKSVEIHIRPLFAHVEFSSAKVYEMFLEQRERREEAPIEWKIADGELTFTFTPDMEQEYSLVLNELKGEAKTRVPKGTFELYAVKEDLFEARPWKGDFHIHSCRSDGQESPAYVAGAYRRAGFDFFALTDHHAYGPSLEAIEAFKDFETDFRMYPGEEVHPPKNLVHHINFGGSFSVNDLHRRGEEYEKEVDEVEKSLPADLGLNEGDRRSFASSQWVFKKIREAGGVSLLCHPYWIWGHHFNVSEALLDAFFKYGGFDAFEVIGGFGVSTAEANALQVARWSEERAKGRSYPVVGVSDSHGTDDCGLFTWYYTIVFAKTPDFPDLRDAIRGNFSVAVCALPNERVHIAGPFRLVKFSHYLQREVFPLHDDECSEEGRLMLKYIAGDKTALPLVAQCKGRVPGLYDKLWAKY